MWFASPFSNPSDSPINKLTVQGGTTAALTAASSIDTSLSLEVDGKDKMTVGAEYSVSGKLIDSVTKKPVADKENSVTTDGESPKGFDTTNSKGEFDVDLKTPDSPGKYDIKAHFDGDSQYKSSDSSVKINVEEKVSSQKNTVTTSKANTDEEQTDEETEEQPEEETKEPEEE